MKSKPISAALTENIHENLTSENLVEHRLSPKLRALVGIVELPKDFDEKQELNAYFENKHLQRNI